MECLEYKIYITDWKRPCKTIALPSMVLDKDCDSGKIKPPVEGR